MDNTDYGLVWRKRVTRDFVTYALRELRGDPVEHEHAAGVHVQATAILEREEPCVGAAQALGIVHGGS